MLNKTLHYEAFYFFPKDTPIYIIYPFVWKIIFEISKKLTTQKLFFLEVLHILHDKRLGGISMITIILFIVLMLIFFIFARYEEDRWRCAGYSAIQRTMSPANRSRLSKR